MAPSLPRLSFLLLVGVLVSACGESAQKEQTDAAAMQAPDASADEAAIDKVRADYVANYNAHQPAAVAAMFTDSAYGLWANGAVTMSKAALQDRLQQEMAGSPTVGIETGDIMVFGDNAVARGSYTVNVTAPDSTPISLAGNYLTQFERVNGTWMISGVITNYSAPPPAGVEMVEDTAGGPPPDNGTMGDLATAWTQAFDSGNWAGVAGLYTTDAVVGFSNSPTIGPDSIQARFAARWGDTKPQIEIHDVGTVNLSDDYALDGGWYQVKASASDANAIQAGTYLNLLHKDADGTWKIQWGVSNGQPTPAT